MIRKFKTLGVAMVAVLAMSALVATAAQAQFTASSYPKSGTATSVKGNDTFSTEAGVVQCHAHFHTGPIAAGDPTIVAEVTYKDCSAFGFAATVNMNGCKYTFHDTANNHQNKVTVGCPAGKSIQIVAGPCEATVGAQGPLGNVVTTTSGNHVNVQAKVTGIAYNATKDGFLCPFNGTGAKAGASYTQHAPVTVEPIGGGSISVH